MKIKNEFIEMQNDLSIKGLLPTAYPFDQAEWDAVLARYYTNNEIEENKKKKLEELLPQFLNHFEKNTGLFYLPSRAHISMGKRIADFVYVVHQEDAKKANLSPEKSLEALQKFSADLALALSNNNDTLDHKGVAAFNMRLNINQPIEQLMNIEINVKGKNKLLEEFLGHNKQKMIDLLQLLLDPSATPNDLLEMMDNYFQTNDGRSILHLVLLFTDRALGENVLTTKRVQGRFYQGLHELLNTPGYRHKEIPLFRKKIQEATPDDKKKRTKQLVDYIENTKPARVQNEGYNYFYTLFPAEKEKAITKKRHHDEALTWKSYLKPGLFFAALITLIGLTAGSVIPLMFLFVLLLPTVQPMVSSIKEGGWTGLIHDINHVFTFAWLEAHKTSIACALLGMVTVGGTFFALDVFNVLSSSITFNLPMFGETTLGTVVLTAIMPAVATIGSMIPKWFFSKKLKENEFEEFEIEEFNNQIKQQQKGVVKMEKLEVEKPEESNEETMASITEGFMDSARKKLGFT